MSHVGGWLGRPQSTRAAHQSRRHHSAYCSSIASRAMRTGKLTPSDIGSTASSGRRVACPRVVARLQRTQADAVRRHQSSRSIASGAIRNWLFWRRLHGPAYRPVSHGRIRLAVVRRWRTLVDYTQTARRDLLRRRLAWATWQCCRLAFVLHAWLFPRQLFECHEQRRDEEDTE